MSSTKSKSFIKNPLSTRNDDNQGIIEDMNPEIPEALVEQTGLGQMPEGTGILGFNNDSNNFISAYANRKNEKKFKENIEKIPSLGDLSVSKIEKQQSQTSLSETIVEKIKETLSFAKDFFVPVTGATVFAACVFAVNSPAEASEIAQNVMSTFSNLGIDTIQTFATEMSTSLADNAMSFFDNIKSFVQTSLSTFSAEVTSLDLPNHIYIAFEDHLFNMTENIKNLKELGLDSQLYEHIRRFNLDNMPDAETAMKVMTAVGELAKEATYEFGLQESHIKTLETALASIPSPSPSGVEKILNNVATYTTLATVTITAAAASFSSSFRETVGNFAEKTSSLFNSARKALLQKDKDKDITTSAFMETEHSIGY